MLNISKGNSLNFLSMFLTVNVKKKIYENLIKKITFALITSVGLFAKYELSNNIYHFRVTIFIKKN